MLTDSRSEESSQEAVYAEEIDLVSESCSVSRRQPWRDKQLLSRFSRWYYQQCREVKNEIKGKGRITREVRVGMDSYKKDNRARDSMPARKIREGGILVAKARRKRGFDRISISGMENKE